jgi:hypothetical protein
MQLSPKRIVHTHLIQSLFHSLGLLQTKKFRMGIQCQHLSFTKVSKSERGQ